MDYKYTVRYSKRKTLAIKISAEEGLVVLAPYNCSKKYIDKLLKEKQQWIEKNYKDIYELRTSIGDRENIEKIMFLGKVYNIKIRYSSLKKSAAALEGDTVTVRLFGALEFNEENRIKALRTVLRAWYAEEGYEILQQKTSRYAERLGVKFNKITIKDVKTRWGSCSSLGNINYNIRLIMMPEDVVDYIVLHELSHLVYMNHSKEFWKYVESFMADYKSREEKLKRLSSSVKLYWKF